MRFITYLGLRGLLTPRRWQTAMLLIALALLVWLTAPK